MSDASSSLRIIRGPEVDRLTGVHESARNRPEFWGNSLGVKITDKAVGWVEGEVIAWIKAGWHCAMRSRRRRPICPPARDTAYACDASGVRRRAR